MSVRLLNCFLSAFVAIILLNGCSKQTTKTKIIADTGNNNLSSEASDMTQVTGTSPDLPHQSEAPVSDIEIETSNKIVRTIQPTVTTPSKQTTTTMTAEPLKQELKTIQQPKENNKELAQLLFLEGRTHVLLKDYDSAIISFSNAIRYDSDYLDAYYNRGLAHYSKKNFDLAILDFTQAIRLEPYFTDSYLKRATAYANNNALDLAIVDFTQVIRLDPENVSAYEGRGLIYGLQKDFDRAIEDWEIALRIDPTNVETRRYLEMTREMRGY